MADLSVDVALSHAAPHQTGFSPRAPKRKLKRLQSIAKYDPSQPRDEQGRWSRMTALKHKYPIVAENFARGPGTFNPGDPRTIEAHTREVIRQWGPQLTHEALTGISKRFGSNIERLMDTVLPLHDIGKPEAIFSGAGKEAQHQFTIPIMQSILHREGFGERDIALATELMNHDLIGPLLDPRKGGSDRVIAAKLTAKAKKAGMNVADFARLQLAFYHADAAAYPFIRKHMRWDASGAWSFRGHPKIAAIEALTRATKYDPSQPRDAEGQWAKMAEASSATFDKAREYDRLQQGHDTNYAVFDYVQGGARYMNEHLRAGKVRYADRRHVELIDAQMRRNPLPEDTTLTRTIATRVVESLNVGDVFQDGGYVSTTKNPAKIDAIRDDIGVKPGLQSLLSIHAPKGLGHIDVNAELGPHGYENQEEVILPRGTKFEVVSKENGVLKVRVVS